MQKPCDENLYHPANYDVDEEGHFYNMGSADLPHNSNFCSSNILYICEKPLANAPLPLEIENYPKDQG